jgi:cysteine-rich repeat protein
MLLAAALLLAPRPAAAVDLSGTYVSVAEALGAPCTLTFAQSATALTITGPCTFGNTYMFDLAGTVDPGTGAFSASGTLSNFCETPGSVTMTGTGDGEIFTATASCGSFTSGVSGTKCANGVLDATEDCEDGNTAPGDCCSPTCQFEPEGTSCTPDANACTRDVCDGAGQCEHPPDPSASGAPCSTDLNVCTDDVCDAGGQCTHPANTAPCDDLNPCTEPDACTGGGCVGGAVVPECVGAIDLSGEWILSPPFFLAGDERHFEQTGVVLRSSVPGAPVHEEGWVNSATGGFEARTFITYFTAQCYEIISATAAADAQTFTGQRTFYCGLDGIFGPYAVTGQRCVPDGCLLRCVPGGLSCLAADEGGQLVVRARSGQLPTRWRLRHSGTADLGDPTATTDYRVCLETQAGGYSEVALHGSGWRATALGVRYRATSGAIRRLAMTSGPGGVSLTGSLTAASPPLPLPTPVRLKLVRDGPVPACFETTFAAPSVNDPTRFRATE